MPAEPLFALVESFFCDHLQKVRGASPHTVAAYRDAVMLFLQFMADRRAVPVGRLRLIDLQAEIVAAFLQRNYSAHVNRVPRVVSSNSISVAVV